MGAKAISVVMQCTVASKQKGWSIVMPLPMHDDCPSMSLSNHYSTQRIMKSRERVAIVFIVPSGCCDVQVLQEDGIKFDR